MQSGIHKKLASYFFAKLPEEQRPKIVDIYEKNLEKLLSSKKVMESEG